MKQGKEITGEVDFTCPECGNEHSETKHLGQVEIPSSTLSYARKIVPFFEEYGVGTYGAGQLNGKTMPFAVRELENELKEDDQEIINVDEAADEIGNRAMDLLQAQLNAQGQSVNDLPPDTSVVGFQVVGYDANKDSKTIRLDLGRQVYRHNITDIGCTYAGRGEVVEALWGLQDEEDWHTPTYGAFSLQDAIEYAQFLIRTTADHQSFSSRMATVGGKIDVALVTPFDGFRWIQKKSLT